MYTYKIVTLVRLRLGFSQHYFHRVEMGSNAYPRVAVGEPFQFFSRSPVRACIESGGFGDWIGFPLVGHHPHFPMELVGDDDDDDTFRPFCSN